MKIWVIGTIVFSSLAFGAGNFPKRIQGQIHQVLRQEHLKQMKIAFDRYNSGTPSSLVIAAREVGFTDAKINALIKHYSSQFRDARLHAQWENDEIVLREQGHTITIGPDDVHLQQIRVDGKPFHWNRNVSVAENLQIYDGLFNSSEKHASRWLPSLMSEAWADDLFRLQISGIQLYFLVTSVGEKGEELYRLNGKVQEMIALCDAPETPAGEADPLLKALMGEGSILRKFEGDPILLRTCADLKTYASRPVGHVEGDPIYPKIPADLCANLNHLANCFRNQMSSPSASGAKSKPDKSEWSDPGSATPDGAAKAH